MLIHGRYQAFALVVLALATSWLGAFELDLAAENDPRIDTKFDVIVRVDKFSPRLKPLWLEALAQPEVDLKRQAADAIVRAHTLGMPDLAETVPLLLAEMENPAAGPIVRLAMARALVALDARQTAAILMKHAATDGFDMARLLEPTLARWNHQPMRAVWLARLADPKTEHGPLLLALRAVGVLKLVEAVPHLRRLAFDARSASDLRREAAQSWAIIQTSGLEETARPMAADTSAKKDFDRLIAATLLSHHRGSTAEALLLKMATDPQPAVATIAARRLLELGPPLLKPIASALIKNRDSGLRMIGAQSLAALKTIEAVAQLGPLLDDPCYPLRVSVQESLVRLAGEAQLAEAVQRATMQVLTSAGPHGREQGVFVIGMIRHQPAAPRLLQLLDDSYSEVSVPAAWALRRLLVPATAPVLEGRLRDVLKKGAQPVPEPVALAFSRAEVAHRQQVHLIEALGLLKHRPAVPLLKQFLPTPPPPIGRPRDINSPTWHDGMRSSAIWALGHIYAGETAPDIVKELSGRLGRGALPTDESEYIRAMAAISLGRMKVQEVVPVLREIQKSEGPVVVLRRACGWALGQITGEPPLTFTPPRHVQEMWHSNWFLEPLKP
jgi:HEAT repeat protein